MPGAQPRRAFQQRMASTARRGSFTPPGVPGVYRVPRTRVVTTQAADVGSVGQPSGWIQLPDYTITLPFVSADLWTATVGVSGDADTWHDDEITDEELAAYAGTGSGPYDEDSPSGENSPETSLYQQVWTISRIAPNFIVGVAETTTGEVAGGSLVNLTLGESDGTFVPPSDPPGADFLEWESDRGVLVGSLVIEGESRSGPDVAGAAHLSTLTGSTFRTQAVLDAMTQIHAVPVADWAPFSVSVTASDFLEPGAETGQTLTLWVTTDALSDPGTGVRGGSPPSSAVYRTQVGEATVTATVRPPRYRIVAGSDDTWSPSPSWNAYLWDAGLFLGSAWTDLTHPADPLPTGCAELHYLVAPGDSPDVAAMDYSSPWCERYRNEFGIGGSTAGAAPDAGSHVWVIWYGPTFDIDTDPTPGVDPASTIPASIAENGTG